MTPGLVIIGAGAAGLMAAQTAAARLPFLPVHVFERLPESGCKLCRTGGGRGNLSHQTDEAGFAARFGRQGRFTIPAFRSLPPEQLQRHLARLHVPTRIEPDGRIYPVSNSAEQVRNALYEACRQAGVRFHFSRPVRELRAPGPGGKTWTVNGHPAQAVILAAGGQSAPALGSDGSGFQLAKSLGYELTPPMPALVPILLNDTWPSEHSGVSLPRATLLIPGKRQPVAQADGELLFTHRGISGPAALNLSGQIARHLADQGHCPLQLRLLDEKPDGEQLRREAGSVTLHNWLSHSLPRGLAKTLLEVAGIPPDLTGSRLNRLQMDRLATTLHALPLSVRGTGGFGESMVTSGGVALKQVHPETLEGRLTPGLFFAGEVLDMDGPTGGWNLQWAFSSGRLAAESACQIFRLSAMESQT